jgi:hypothetical protein
MSKRFAQSLIGAFFLLSVTLSTANAVIDQPSLELKSKDTVLLDKVRNWRFAEQARRQLANIGMPR